jgi:phage protein D
VASLSLNDQEGKGSRLRTPYCSVFVNQDDILTGVDSFEVTNASHFAADTFRLTAAIDKLPPNLGIEYWSDATGDELAIYAGFNSQGVGTTPQLLIYAQVDDVVVDIVGRALTLSGRDLSAVFLDSKTAEIFQDKTSSQIAQVLAARHNLQASVTPTNPWVGSFYELYHARITKDQSEWDLLMFLAEQENYDVWVAGQTLYFQPPVPLTVDPYVLTWSDQGQGNRVANFENLKMQRSETLARDVIVQVLSWNQAQGKTITSTLTRNQPQKGQRQTQPQTYTFYPPNLNKQQADNFARGKMEDITKHERVISGVLPGDSLLTNRSLVKLVGTGTSWDQFYHVDTVTRRMSFTEGYTMEFRAKNHSPKSTV